MNSRQPARRARNLLLASVGMMTLAGCAGAQAEAKSTTPQQITQAEAQQGAEANVQILQEFGGAMTGPQATYVESVGKTIAVQSGLGNARERIVQGQGFFWNGRVGCRRGPGRGTGDDPRGQGRESHTHGNAPMDSGRRNAGAGPARRQAVIGGRNGVAARDDATACASWSPGALPIHWNVGKGTSAPARPGAWPQQWA